MTHPAAPPRRVHARRRAAALAAGIALAAVLRATAAPASLPEFTHPQPASWLNGPPLEAAALRGRPVLVEFWTSECSNCLASLPWMQRVAARYRAQGLAIVGVHTPELGIERDPAHVRDAVRRLGIEYPVMLDADYSYWRALDNHYWPAFYLYDPAGRLVGTRLGELHAGEPAADAFERQIAGLTVPGR